MSNVRTRYLSVGKGSKVEIIRPYTSRGRGQVTAIYGIGEYCLVRWDDGSQSTERVDHLVATP